MNLPPLFDLGSLTEDERIALIADVVKDGNRTGFIVESRAKIRRYISKLKLRNPAILVENISGGPTKGTFLIRLSIQNTAGN